MLQRNLFCSKEAMNGRLDGGSSEELLFFFLIERLMFLPFLTMLIVEMLQVVIRSKWMLEILHISCLFPFRTDLHLPTTVNTKLAFCCQCFIRGIRAALADFDTMFESMLALMWCRPWCTLRSHPSVRKMKDSCFFCSPSSHRRGKYVLTSFFGIYVGLRRSGTYLFTVLFYFYLRSFSTIYGFDRK